MSREAGSGWLQSVRGLAKRLLAGQPAGQPKREDGINSNPEDVACCDGQVHIAYRGVSDDRLYIVYARKWSEVRYFRQNGLRVFCSGCRRRLL